MIQAYLTVKDNPRGVISALRRLRNTESGYYRVRDEWNPISPTGKAARLYFLQRFSFNGIYRENRSGDFNVPYGGRTHLAVADEAHILAISCALSAVELRHCDFTEVLDRARCGDFVYLDPPYTVKHNNNGFIKYNASLYSWQNQVTLADVANELRRRGCFVMVTNAYHQPLLRLFKRGFAVVQLRRQSVIGSKPEYRGQISEALITTI